MVAAGLSLVLAGAPGARAAEIEGVSFADTAVVGGTKLLLNGVGLRKVDVFVKVYVAGLYLQSTTHDGAAAVQTDETKRLELRFLREVTHDEMNDGSREGFAITAPSGLSEEKERFMSFFTAPLEAGEVCEIDYVPGKGTTVTIAGEVKGTVAGPEFMRALFGIWLGANAPVNAALRDGLLGKS
jgi:Chalcone isomerase-like